MTKNKGGRPSGDKTRCSGQWTEARWRSFIQSNLRIGSRKWAPINEVKKEARVARGLYECASCKEHVAPTVREGRKRSNNIFVDHISPIVDPAVGFTTWDEYIEGMFAEKDNLQLLCKHCHDNKSAGERKIAVERRGFYKKYPSEYPVYVSMKGRCLNPNKSDYQYYGGKGVKIDSRWEESFLNFYEDMGPRPENTTLDRIDPLGDYSPENCRWADWETQCNNKSNSVHVSYNGETKTLSQWGKDTGISPQLISYRISHDFTIGEALGFEEKPNKEALKQRRKERD